MRINFLESLKKILIPTLEKKLQVKQQVVAVVAATVLGVFSSSFIVGLCAWTACEFFFAFKNKQRKVTPKESTSPENAIFQANFPFNPEVTNALSEGKLEKLLTSEKILLIVRNRRDMMQSYTMDIEKLEKGLKILKETSSSRLENFQPLIENELELEAVLRYAVLKDNIAGYYVGRTGFIMAKNPSDLQKIRQEAEKGDHSGMITLLDKEQLLQALQKIQAILKGTQFPPLSYSDHESQDFYLEVQRSLLFNLFTQAVRALPPEAFEVISSSGFPGPVVMGNVMNFLLEKEIIYGWCWDSNRLHIKTEGLSLSKIPDSKWKITP